MYSNKSIMKIITKITQINNTNDNFKQTNMHFEQAHDYKSFKHLNIIQKSFISIAF